MKVKAVMTALIGLAATCMAIDTVGLHEYKSSCRSCHGAPYKGSNMLMSDEWVDLFKNSLAKLKNKHASNQKAMEILNSDKFIQEDAVKLLEFLKNNAQDSGTVRSCSGVSCG